MLLTKILGFIVPIILGMLGKMADRLNQKNLEKGEEEKEEEEYSYIAIGLIIICGIYSFVNIFTDDVIFSGLLWIQNHWLIAGIYIFGVAVLPSVVAEKERGKGVFWAKEDYTVQNRKHNIRGAVASCSVFVLAYSLVKDFSYLKSFYIEDIVPAIASASVWMAIIYQKVERMKYKERRGCCAS